MDKNNFFTVFGIVTLLGINFELCSSERSIQGSYRETFDMSLLYAESLAQQNNRENNFSQLYKELRIPQVQVCQRKKTQKTLQSHIIDDYAGECRK